MPVPTCPCSPILLFRDAPFHTALFAPRLCCHMGPFHHSAMPNTPVPPCPHELVRRPPRALMRSGVRASVRFWPRDFSPMTPCPCTLVSAYPFGFMFPCPHRAPCPGAAEQACPRADVLALPRAPGPREPVAGAPLHIWPGVHDPCLPTLVPTYPYSPS